MIFCISVILIILLLVIPNVTSKNTVVKNKGCDAQIEVVNSQILLYEIENGKLPRNIYWFNKWQSTLFEQKKQGCLSKWQKKSLLKMVKPMLNKGGFTMIETLFCTCYYLYDVLYFNAYSCSTKKWYC